MLTDGELLRRYAEDGSQAAFEELVQRHVHVVYRAALRRVGGNAHAADDVTQRVFTDLARKARSLADRPSLAGWLHTGTRFAAAETVRAERRRRVHEQEAQAMHELESESPVSPDRLEPFLDEVLDLLPERDRGAVLLHLFEGKTFAEVGAALSLSPDAARMRVNRALDRLRGALAGRGITSSAAALSVALSVQSGLAAPPALAATVAGHALAQAGASSGGLQFLGRLFRRMRSSPLASGAGALTVAGIGGLALFALHRGARQTKQLAQAPAADAREAVGAPAAPAAVTTEASTPDRAANSGSEAQPPAAAPAAGAVSFAGLSGPEKHILKALWGGHRGLGPSSANELSLRVGPRAPNADDFSAGRDLLLSRGWVRAGRDPWTVALTAKGRLYCLAHEAEIDAYPAFYHARRAGD